MPDDELRGFLEAGQSAARKAGGIILEALSRETNSQLQVKSGIDLVTETDKACEEAIIEQLRIKYPEHKFLGEESTFGGGQGGGGELTDDPTWVIDPLDGTTNFVHAYPLFCVSIALAVGRVPVVGVVFNPVLGEMYTAARGQGAQLNGKKIQVRATKGLSDALVINNIGAARDEQFIQTTLARLGQLLRSNVQAIRMSGSAAQNMCHVAAGKLDCYYEDGYGGPWDVAAGCVIVWEAGGAVRTLDNEAFVLRPGKGRMVCGHSAVVDAVCGAIRTADKDDEFGALVRSSMAVIAKVLDLFGPLALAISFNGGKDACVVLFLLMTVLAERGQMHLLSCATSKAMPIVYFEKDEFAAVKDFMRDVEEQFVLKPRTYTVSYKEGMQDLVDNHGVKAVLMGQRRGDPWTDSMEVLTPSTPGWPAFTRVNPILEWQYRHVWKFLRGCRLPYCSLYDRGYTSLGEARVTSPNPALRKRTGSYRPAFELAEEHLERNSRTPTSVRSEEGEPRDDDKDDDNVADGVLEGETGGSGSVGGSGGSGGGGSGGDSDQGPAPRTVGWAGKWADDVDGHELLSPGAPRGGRPWWEQEEGDAKGEPALPESGDGGGAAAATGKASDPNGGDGGGSGSDGSLLLDSPR